ncbi:hypothetical protein AMAG_03225 [Allomyces macrogynus ATCC 38327]|uniref:RRM domain-containing protein n=1 Tax=Allomyces macrogynus (strain ATCC 38327) TaxID=578462 RepID=A0A0L0S4U0_ALLM3|nr:hypothetical protein AMAG_03225 [Allomyces macrogynus ATCC 38327]|eukprot:KNE57522.1 hypothetical protein AMAG_03225 [Allomyces macrogynus ATCC 38327]
MAKTGNKPARKVAPKPSPISKPEKAAPKKKAAPAPVSEDELPFDESDGDEDDDEDEDAEDDVEITVYDNATPGDAAAAASDKEPRGVVYLGRIPHGFYEKEMKEYFSQFGQVTRLRLSRNKKTGASKHYAFIEFESEAVAEVVASTMDNYLLFGHVLRCRVIPRDQVHPDLFKNADRKFRIINTAAIHQRRHNTVDAKTAEKRAKNLVIKAAKKQALLAELGIDYTVPVPELKESKTAAADAAQWRRRRTRRPSRRRRWRRVKRRRRRRRPWCGPRPRRRPSRSCRHRVRPPRRPSARPSSRSSLPSRPCPQRRRQRRRKRP